MPKWSEDKSKENANGEIISYINDLNYTSLWDVVKQQKQRS